MVILFEADVADIPHVASRLGDVDAFDPQSAKGVADLHGCRIEDQCRSTRGASGRAQRRPRCGLGNRRTVGGRRDAVARAPVTGTRTADRREDGNGNRATPRGFSAPRRYAIHTGAFFNSAICPA